MIYLGIPTYNGLIHHTTVAGLCQVSRHCGKSGMGIALDVIPHDAFIGRARNLLVKRFLASPATDLVFIDADVGFSLDDFAKLCRPDVDMAMGLYCVKDDKRLAFPALMTVPEKRLPQEGANDLISLEYGPAGFMRVKRAVFEAMIAKFPEEYYEDGTEGKIYDLFPCGRIGNSFIGEDISFCQRAKECGFDIWAVQGTNLLHSGEKTWPAKWQIDVQVAA